MKDLLIAELAASPTIDGRHVCREFLQVRLLEELQDAGATSAMAFHGGTALRLLFRTPRFSEDLDFALLGDRHDFDFAALLARCKPGLVRDGYDVTISVKTSTVVQKAFVKFSGLLYEVGLSPMRNETMLIKLEVDTNPPDGATTTTSRVPRSFGAPVRVLHHDQASLFAGKLGAVLTREWVKGRDVFDLVWYASNAAWPEPNYAMLAASLEQSGWTGGPIGPDTWRDAVWQRLSRDADWGAVRNDVERFAMKPGVVDWVTADAVRSALGL